MHVYSVPLHYPQLDELLHPLRLELGKRFRCVEVEVSSPPDLTMWPWALAAPGLCGTPRLVEAGGLHNILTPERRDTQYALSSIAHAVDMPGALLLGCGAASIPAERHAGVMLINDCQRLRRSKSEVVLFRPQPADRERDDLPTSAAAAASASPAPLPGRDVPRRLPCAGCAVGTNANLLASAGEMGPALRVRVAKHRPGSSADFVQCLREAVAAAAPGEATALAGVFRVLQGRVRAHVMPDLPPDAPVGSEEELRQWWEYRTMGPELTCFTTLLTRDPTGGRLNLRLQHTHFFGSSATEGGHYHGDATPEEMLIEGYFVPCESLWRVGDALDAPLL